MHEQMTINDFLPEAEKVPEEMFKPSCEAPDEPEEDLPVVDWVIQGTFTCSGYAVVQAKTQDEAEALGKALSQRKFSDFQDYDLEYIESVYREDGYV